MGWGTLRLQNASAGSKGVSIATILLALSVTTSSQAAGRGNVYTIGNYPVEANDKNAVTAKKRAHEEGQQAALGALFKRLLPVTSYAALERLNLADASQLVDGVAIRSERNSRTRYIANLDFSFHREAVQELLRREGVPFIDEQAPKTVLIPLWFKNGALAPAPRAWTSIWTMLDLPNSLTPLNVRSAPPGITLESPQDAMNAASSVAEALRESYVVFAIGEPEIASKRLEVTLVGQDAAGTLNWKKTYRFVDGDAAYAMELAAVITLGVMEGRWKAARWDGTTAEVGPAADFSFSSSGASSGQVVQMQVVFSGLNEWNTLRGRLLSMPGVDDVRIGAVSAQSADVSVRYPGGAGTLANAMARQGLLLINQAGGWQLRSAY